MHKINVHFKSAFNEENLSSGDVSADTAKDKLDVGWRTVTVTVRHTKKAFAYLYRTSEEFVLLKTAGNINLRKKIMKI